MHTTTTTTGTGYDLRHGLTLQETAHGLTVCGHPHRQYKARHELKRHGARWNATRRQWEATTPHDCDTLRRWLTHQEPATAAQGVNVTSLL